jgi:hypothetical protein
MKKLIALSLLAIPAISFADYVDVIAGKFNPGCNMAAYLPIVKDFNETWGKEYGYKAEILVPVQSRDLSTFYWVGRVSNGVAFGKGMDAWVAGMSDPNSVPAKLMARIRACVTNESRSGYLTY